MRTSRDKCVGSVLTVFAGLLVLTDAVWPQPQMSETGLSVIWVGNDVKLAYTGSHNASFAFDSVWSSLQSVLAPVKVDDSRPPADETLIQAAFARFRSNALSHNFVPSKFYPRGIQFEPDAKQERQWLRSVTVELDDRRTATARQDLLDVDQESYILRLDRDNGARLIANSSLGILHAFETLSQLFLRHSTGKANEAYSPYTPVHIIDRPRFAHRGLNIDIARNAITSEQVMHTIRAMAACKLNRIHIHATDAQSWPLEIPSLPELASKGSYADDQIWTSDMLHSVQHYGAIHGVQVLLEIDMPGHTSSIALAYPELITAFVESDWQRYSMEPPSGQLKLNSTAVSTFIETLMQDLLPRTKPYSSFFHMGGDELNEAAHGLDDTVRSSDPAVLKPLVQAFVDHVLKTIKKHDMTPIMWEEMLLDWNLQLPEDTIIQTWRTAEALEQVLKKGHRTLFGSSDYWYLDCGFGFWADPDPDDPNSLEEPYQDSCAPYKPWRHVYSYNPLHGVAEGLQHLIIGGETHMWDELTDSVSMDFKLWPRVAASAEVLWTGPGQKLDESVTRRLAEFRERLVRQGVNADVVQMEFCLRNPGSCTFRRQNRNPH